MRNDILGVAVVYIGIVMMSHRWIFLPMQGFLSVEQMVMSCDRELKGLPCGCDVRVNRLPSYNVFGCNPHTLSCFQYPIILISDIEW